MDRPRPDGELADSLIRLSRDHTEALTRIAGSTQVIASEIAAAAVNRIEIARTLVMVTERQERDAAADMARSAHAVAEVKAHISAETDALSAAVVSAIRGTAVPRIVGWLIAAAAMVTAAALSAIVLLRANP